MGRAIANVNDFTGFPLSGHDILRWAADIERLEPTRTVEEVAFLMDAFKKGEMDWDKEKGVTNIFKGLRRVTRDEETGELKLLKPQW